MVRKLMGWDRAPGSWAGPKAALAVALVGAGLLWHILACTESPMSYAPDGKHLALTLMHPYDVEGEKGFPPGAHSFRVLVLSDMANWRVLEECTDAMLSAPAFSPDGARIAYLRVALLANEQLEDMKKAAEQADGKMPATWPAAVAAALTPTARAGEPPAQELQKTEGKFDADKAATAVWRQGILVVRDAKTGAVLSNTLLPRMLPTTDADGEGMVIMNYILTRPQWSADGKWLSLATPQGLRLVDPAARHERILLTGNIQAAMSPDGKRLAALADQSGDQRKLSVFDVSTGQVTTSANVPPRVSLTGLAWAGPAKVALLEAPRDDQTTDPSVHLLDLASGKLTSTPIKLPPHAYDDKSNTGMLAVSPDGQRVVVSYTEDLFFLDQAGKVLKHLNDENVVYAQPTFSPDGKQVAVKLFAKPKEAGAPPTVTDIGFFSPDGKELVRTEVPPSKAKLTPAKKPQDGPAPNRF